MIRLALGDAALRWANVASDLPAAGTIAASAAVIAGGVAFTTVLLRRRSFSRRPPPAGAPASTRLVSRPESLNGAEPILISPAFLDAAIHELRPPLDTIQGLADFLYAPPHDLTAAERGEYTALLLDSSRKVASYVSQLGDLVRIVHGNLHLNERDIDAAELLEAAIRQCKDAAEESDVSIIATLHEGIELHCDPSRLRDSIARIIMLALSSSPPGGDVLLGIERMADGGIAFTVRHRGRLPGDSLAAMMSPDIARSSIDALGLPIALRMAVLHGGTVITGPAAHGMSFLRLSLPPGRVAWAADSAPERHGHAA